MKLVRSSLYHRYSTYQCGYDYTIKCNYQLFLFQLHIIRCILRPTLSFAAKKVVPPVHKIKPL